MKLLNSYVNLGLGSSPSLVPNVTVSASINSCNLNWNGVIGANAYDIWNTPYGNSRVYVGRTSGLTYTVTGLAGATNYIFEVVASNSSGIIYTTTTSATTKVLTANYTYIAPGTTQQFLGHTTSTRTAFYLTGLNAGNNSWTGMRIGFTNDQASSYNVIGAYMAKTGASAPLTEDINTGFVTIFSEHAGNGPILISAGSSTHNKVTWFGGGAGTLVSQSFPDGAVDLVIEVSGGAPLGKWIYQTSIGYYPWTSYDTLGTLPSTSNTINTSTGLTNSFGVLPNMVIKFEGLTTPVVTIPIVGDSHIWGYGDGNGVNDSIGIPARLFSRWVAASKYYVPINFGYTGQTSPDIATRWSNYLADGFDFRTAAIEFGSINDWVNSLPASGWQTNWNSITNSTNQPILPILGGVYGSNTSANVSDQKTEWSWIASNRPDLCYGITTNLVTSSTMTWALSADVFSDGSHPNTAGYTQWENDAHVQIENFIAAKVALYG